MLSADVSLSFQTKSEGCFPKSKWYRLIDITNVDKHDAGKVFNVGFCRPVSAAYEDAASSQGTGAGHSQHAGNRSCLLALSGLFASIPHSAASAARQ